MMDWPQAGWQKYYSHTHRRNTGGFCGKMLSAGGHFITLLCCLVVDKLMEGPRNGCYTLWNVLSSSAENSQIVSHLLQDALSMEHAWFTTATNLLVLYSIIFCCILRVYQDTNKDSIRKSV